MTAQAVDPTGGVTAILLDRGVLGACVLILGALAWWLIRREAARADDAQEQLTELHGKIRDDVLPAVIRASDTQATVSQLLVKLSDILPDVVSALRDHNRGRR